MRESQRKVKIVPRFILSDMEREKLFLSSPTMFPEDMPCAMCGCRWMQHKGEVCPVKLGTYRRTIFGITPIAPVFLNSKTAFVPDVEFYKEPNFDVI